MNSAVLGTETGVYVLSGNEPESVGLADQRISAIHAWQNPDGKTVILAGSYGNGLFRSEDGGTSWAPVSDGLTAPAFRTIVPDPLNPGAILSGTEPGRIFRSRDGGVGWQELEGIRALDG